MKINNNDNDLVGCQFFPVYIGETSPCKNGLIIPVLNIVKKQE